VSESRRLSNVRHFLRRSRFSTRVNLPRILTISPQTILAGSLLNFGKKPALSSSFVALGLFEDAEQIDPTDVYGAELMGRIRGCVHVETNFSMTYLAKPCSESCIATSHRSLEHLTQERESLQSMKGQPAQFTPLIAALEKLGPHDHLCSIYESQQEHLTVAISFIRIGLDRGEKCVCVADDGTLGDIREALQAEGIDVDHAGASKSLVWTAKEKAYLELGSFEIDRVFSFWKEATALAISEGFSALRAIDEAGWVFTGSLGLDRWMEYESRLTHSLSQRNCVTLCQYDRRLFSPEFLLNVIRTHPVIVYGDTVCRNLYHVPPDEFGGKDNPVSEINRLLSNIREHERVESALREEQDELRRTINQRKRVEEELRRSETHLAERQKLSHTGSWTWNVSSGEFFGSREASRIFAFDSEKTKPCYPISLERIHPDDRPLVKQTINGAVHEKTDWELDYPIVLPEQSIKAVHAVGHPVLNSHGDGVECNGAVMGVTEQRQARAALIKAFDGIKTLKDQLHRENQALREEIDHMPMFEEIVGSSPALQAVLSRVARVAPTDSTVLIMGETGTGKELVARAIHKGSQRSARSFVSVNCAAVPPSLIASELFGHEKGAFTGAHQRQLGRFELAEGGTIFLDEIGELPAETAVALLRVLQEREFERVGGSQRISTNVRVIAATNRDLQAATAAGTFRLDLFYRLNVFPIKVPPLRERKEDIPTLLEYFVKRYAARVGKNIKNVDAGTLELLKAYHWPGNIRELQNVIERSVILCQSEVFSVDDSWLSRESPQQNPPRPLAGRLIDGQREMIEAALTESKGRVSGPSGAAAKLEIPASTLESRIKALKINKHRFKAG
jgi:DNA-binding NtrC family response regulator/PAS domain-containing protein